MGWHGCVGGVWCVRYGCVVCNVEEGVCKKYMQPYR